MLKILKVLFRWSLNIPQESICQGMKIDRRTFKKIITKFMKIVNVYDDKRHDKLGGPGVVVEIDETALIIRLRLIEVEFQKIKQMLFVLLKWKIKLLVLLLV